MAVFNGGSASRLFMFYLQNTYTKCSLCAGTLLNAYKHPILTNNPTRETLLLSLGMRKQWHEENRGLAARWQSWDLNWGHSTVYQGQVGGRAARRKGRWESWRLTYPLREPGWCRVYMPEGRWGDGIWGPPAPTADLFLLSYFYSRSRPASLNLV